MDENHGYIVFPNHNKTMDEDEMSSCSTVSSLSFSMHVGICAEKPNKRRRLMTDKTPTGHPHQVPLHMQPFSIPNPIQGPLHLSPASTVDRSSSEKRKRGTNYCRNEIKGLLDTIEKIKPKDQSQWDLVQNIHQSEWPGRDRPASSLRKKFREICNSDCDTNQVVCGISKISKTDILRARNIKNSLDNSIWRKLALLKNELDVAKKVKHSVSFRMQTSPHLDATEGERLRCPATTVSENLVKNEGVLTSGLTRSTTLPRTRAFIDLTTINIPLNVPNPLSNIVDVPTVIRIPISPAGQSKLGDLDDVSELGLDQDYDAYQNELKHTAMANKETLPGTLPAQFLSSSKPLPVLVTPSID
mmetsp:Transcript_1007/g.1155  ORF Transcript_1007/g.1155 Transcript_1007/m.1155 type:complete len:358 (-) Transcript_1007:346-1419(-)